MIRPGVLALAVALVVAGCTSAPDPAPGARTTAVAGTPTEAPTGAPAEAPTGALLTVAEEIDGDSFVASDGVEYRVGMINTAEQSECGAAEAAERTYALLADGFTVEAYAADDYGRSVARVWTGEGDLGVILAREGLADDRYLDQFRQQHPTYAAELDVAFTRGEVEQAGLWSTCWAAGTTDPGPVAPLVGVAPGEHAGRTADWPCHPDYVECIPDGPDLDCGEIGHQVRLFGQADPFRLDGNDTTATDGTGCDTYPLWSPAETYPYY